MNLSVWTAVSCSQPTPIGRIWSVTMVPTSMEQRNILLLTNHPYLLERWQTSGREECTAETAWWTKATFLVCGSSSVMYFLTPLQLSYKWAPPSTSPSSLFHSCCRSAHWGQDLVAAGVSMLWKFYFWRREILFVCVKIIHVKEWWKCEYQDVNPVVHQKNSEAEKTRHEVF